MRRDVYTSTVVSPVQFGLAVVAAAVVGFVAERAAGWPLAIVVAVVVLGAGLELSTVRVSVGAGRVVLGLGPWGRPGRVIAAVDVTEVSSTRLGWGQVFGVGVGFHRRMTRLTVRPGPTLCLRLADGEYVRVSTPDPEAARRVLSETAADPDAPAQGTATEPRPWFGPKRVGYGFRPQTWQGWTVVAAFCAAIVAVSVLSTHS